MAKWLGMYQLAENISRNLSVVSLNSGEVVCVIGYWMYFIAFLPTKGNATAENKTWKKAQCCCPGLEKTRKTSAVSF